MQDALEEYQEDQYIEGIMFDRLSECPDDWILWTLDKVPDRRNELIGMIRNAIELYDKTNPLPRNAIVVLRALLKSHGTMSQYDLVAAMDLSRRTIGPLLNELEDRGLVKYPHGPRSGAAITNEGRRLLDTTES
jgi:DNA-binding MarR family transcriptional regulator